MHASAQWQLAGNEHGYWQHQFSVIQQLFSYTVFQQAPHHPLDVDRAAYLSCDCDDVLCCCSDGVNNCRHGAPSLFKISRAPNLYATNYCQAGTETEHLRKIKAQRIYPPMHAKRHHRISATLPFFLNDDSVRIFCATVHFQDFNNAARSYQNERTQESAVVTAANPVELTLFGGNNTTG
jgi:hypothetical protein